MLNKLITKYYFDLKNKTVVYLTKREIKIAYRNNQRKHAEKFSKYLVDKLNQLPLKIEEKTALVIKQKAVKAAQRLDYETLFRLSEILDYSNNKEMVNALILFSNKNN